ncbi:hypothetical protein H0E87_025668 [Populus deltoides]|uniref:ALG11 mannosyltransferase N-terminal domain-containing protein n=1 Tax=Populus deltoides TaxID=3696 RepID=A0A8T2WZQ9_POPDE|nr:hypothetical protein H0E87_025668 [Populus deltoides]
MDASSSWDQGSFELGQGERVSLICARTDCSVLMQTFSMEDLYFWIRREASMCAVDDISDSSPCIHKVLSEDITVLLYLMKGSCAHLAMVNSSWTQSHIEKLWKIPNRIERVYPPCDTSGLQVLPLERPAETPILISVAQFRPEKAHPLQLETFSVAIKRLDADMPRPVLRAPMNTLALVLWNVEYMAAGAIPIAHDSAGPKMGIVLEEDGQQTGFLAQNAEEYADAILKV